jgi:two-component system, chemotaxis family, response regulator WspR
MVDIDYFKPYNDLYGHKSGDECLRQVASALSSTANRAGDLVARYGGEEFAVVLPATSPAGATAMAEALRMKVEALGIPHEASATAPFVTISVGVSTGVPQEGSPSAYVLERADRALYLAKQEGRNRVRSQG